MDGMMDLQVLERRHEEMLREAELNRLKKALRADREGIRHSPVGLDRGMGADQGRRPPPQVLQDAEERQTRTRTHGRTEGHRSDESRNPIAAIHGSRRPRPGVATTSPPRSARRRAGACGSRTAPIGSSSAPMCTCGASTAPASGTGCRW